MDGDACRLHEFFEYCEADSSCSAPLALLSLLLFLLLRAWVDHKELAVSRIPLRLQVDVDLARHQDSSLEGLHVRDVDIGLILLITLQVGPCQIVTNRLDLLDLLQPRAVRRILRHEVELASEFEFGKRRLTFHFRLGESFFTCSCRRWLPAGLLAHELFSRVGGARSAVGHAAWPIVDGE